MKKLFWIICFLFSLTVAVGILWPTSIFIDTTRLGTSYLATPLVKFGNYTGKILQALKTTWRWPKVLQELALLRKQVEELQSALVEAQALQDENDSLRQDLELSKKSSKAFKACSSLGVSRQLGQLALKCGTQDGVTEGLAVVLRGSIIGVVTQVSRSTSMTRLLSSSQSTIDARVGPRSVAGVVRGSFDQGLILDLVPAGAPVSQGDAVVSSNASGQLAPNLLIGKVGEQISLPGETNHVFIVTPTTTWQDDDYALIYWPQ